MIERTRMCLLQRSSTMRGLQPSSDTAFRLCYGCYVCCVCGDVCHAFPCLSAHLLFAALQTQSTQQSSSAYKDCQKIALRRIILTASGGAFRDWPVEKLKTVKVADALKHPNWSMGRKITVDSATLINKGLEVIEAHYLFGVDYDNIDIVIHPQSIIHSMVETQDSSVLAQVSHTETNNICR